MKSRRPSRVFLHIRRCVLRTLYVFLAALCLTVNAQISAPPSQRPVKKPWDLLKIAARVNGLEADGIGPWHLKARFTLFDALGNPKDRGSFEVLWVNRHEEKGIIKSAGFSQVWIVKGRKNATVSGSRSPWPGLLAKTVWGFIHPVYENEYDGIQLASEKPEARNLPIRCVSTVQNDAPNALERAMSKSTLCFDAREPVLLLRIDAFGIKTIYENIFRFHGRYVARDLTVDRGGRVYLKAHLESLEKLNPVDQTEFVPPKKAFEPPKVLLAYMTTEDARSFQIRKVEPKYPADALAAGVSGVVDVKTLIDAAGHVSDVLALDGPPLLQEAALKAVRQYLFRPYMMYGTKTEVETVFPVEFKLPTTR